MATLSVQETDLDGLEATYAAAAAGGDDFPNDGHTILHVKNGGGGAITVTVDSVANCDQGFDHNSATVVDAAEDRFIGPFPTGRFGTSTAITYSGVTTVTIAAISV